VPVQQAPGSPSRFQSGGRTKPARIDDENYGERPMSRRRLPATNACRTLGVGGANDDVHNDGQPLLLFSILISISGKYKELFVTSMLMYPRPLYADAIFDRLSPYAD
jgi:hypothetical protein